MSSLTTPAAAAVAAAPLSATAIAAAADVKTSNSSAGTEVEEEDDAEPAEGDIRVERGDQQSRCRITLHAALSDERHRGVSRFSASSAGQWWVNRQHGDEWQLSYARENVRANVDGGTDAFASAIVLAYNTHGELVLSPDDIWLPIQLQCSKFVNDHAEGQSREAQHARTQRHCASRIRCPLVHACPCSCLL